MNKINFEFKKKVPEKEKLKTSEFEEFVNLTTNISLIDSKEIKYRAYSTVKDQLSYKVNAIQMGDTKHTPSSVNVTIDKHQETWDIEHEGIVLEQFLNIFDKNNQPIYENDLVRITDKNNKTTLIIAKHSASKMYDNDISLTNLGPIYSEISIE